MFYLSSQALIFSNLFYLNECLHFFLALVFKFIHNIYIRSLLSVSHYITVSLGLEEDTALGVPACIGRERDRERQLMTGSRSADERWETDRRSAIAHVLLWRL